MNLYLEIVLSRSHRIGRATAVAVAALFALSPKGLGSDQADAPSIAAMPGADLEDLYAFPSPQTPGNIVLVMDLHPFIPAGMGPSTVFDPSVLYQFKFKDLSAARERLVLQFKFLGTGTNQQVQVAGPATPAQPGTLNVFEPPDPVIGTINGAFTTSNGIKVFAGAREDPFFFDLQRFFAILPDRGTPVNGGSVANPNSLQAASWNVSGQDYFKNLNVMSIIVELPKSMLGTGQVGIWCTTSR